MIYKVLTKVILNCIKPLLPSLINLILYNLASTVEDIRFKKYIIVQEIVHYLRNINAKEGIIVFRPMLRYC